MPIEIKDLDGGIGVSIIGQGVITDKEYVDTLSKHLTQDKTTFKRYKYSLSDYIDVTKAEVSMEAIRRITDICKRAANVNPDAILATVANWDLIYGLARMFQILSEETEWEHEVFRNREDAVIWLKKRVKEKFGISDLTFKD